MISIFAKPAFLNVNPGEPFALRTKPVRAGHLMRVSSMIRGDQIADQIGARLNPTEGYENDTCIYVKPMVRKGDDFKFEGKVNYLDIIDGHNLGQLLNKHPEVNAIVCSQADMETMSGCISNKIVFIPQHHCNFNREKRTRTEIKTVGVIGTRGAFPMLPPDLKIELDKRGMELIEFSRFFTRQDIIDFYKKIDIQMVWRPYKKLLSNPLKLVNGASFGIPTVALDEVAFEELKGCYLPVTTFEQFLMRLDELRNDSDKYMDYSKKCLIKAESYHIEKVGEMYKELDL